MSKHVPVYHLAAKSGLIAAATAANSVLFAFRNPSTTVAMFLHRLEAKGEVVTGYSAAFENALEAYDVSSFDGANYAGGTDLSHPTTAANHAYARIDRDVLLKPPQQTILDTGNVRIATTAALTHGGSPVIASHPFARDGRGELVTADTVPRGKIELAWEAPEVNLERVPRYILPGGGFVIRNPVALAAAGTLRIFVSAIWSEQG